MAHSFDPLVSENRCYGIHQGVYGAEVFLKDVSHVYCDAVREFAAPRTWAHCLLTSSIPIGLFLDLETQLFSVAIEKHSDDQLSKWANNILKRTGYSAPT
ncbi:hypothetical protein GGI21_004786, partial [Coemansia aciculifera]